MQVPGTPGCAGPAIPQPGGTGDTLAHRPLDTQAANLNIGRPEPTVPSPVSESGHRHCGNHYGLVAAVIPGRS